MDHYNTSLQFQISNLQSKINDLTEMKEKEEALLSKIEVSANVDMLSLTNTLRQKIALLTSQIVSTVAQKTELEAHTYDQLTVEQKQCIDLLCECGENSFLLLNFTLLENCRVRYFEAISSLSGATLTDEEMLKIKKHCFDH